VIHKRVQQWSQKAADTPASRQPLCRVFDISRSWSQETAQRAGQPAAVCPLHTAVRQMFEKSGKVYGSRRIRAEWRAQGLGVGRYRIRRLMREWALTAHWRRKFIHTTDSLHRLPLADNLLDRRFRWVAPNQAWASDITYVRTDRGWLYLVTVLDCIAVIFN